MRAILYSDVLNWVLTTSTEVARSPEVIDVEKLQSWLATSVWALIGLNIVALGFFVAGVFAPQVRALTQMVAKRVTNAPAAEVGKAEEAAASSATQSTSETEKSEPSVTIEEASPAAQVEIDTSATTPAPAPASETISTPETPSEASSSPISEELPPPPEMPEASSEIPADIPPEDEDTFGGKTEIIDRKEMEAALAAAEAASHSTPPPEVPAPEVNPFEADEKTEVIVKTSDEEISPPMATEPLSESTKNAENDSSMNTGENEMKSASAFDKSLDELLNTPVEATEEVPIFNIDALEASLDPKDPNKSKEDPSS